MSSENLCAGIQCDGSSSALKFQKIKMKKLWMTTALATCYFFSSTAVLAQELGEFCWNETNTLCALRLNATQHNSFFSFVGNEICPDEPSLSHVR